MTESTVRSIELRPISGAAAGAILSHAAPPDVAVAQDYPTEFSVGIASQVGSTSPLGPFFLHCLADDVVVGEIGGGFVEPGVVEIGYAIVASCWGRGYATEAVRALVAIARRNPAIERITAHNPVERPASGRVLQKAGFEFVGESDDEHEGQPMRVQAWRLNLR